MRRLLATFPTGAPGAALFLLRLSLATHVSVTCVLQNAYALPIWARGLVLLVAVVLGLGFLTPIVSLLSASAAALLSLHLGMSPDEESAFVLIDGIVVAMLGPGGYSIDAHRFGRRVVVLTNRGESRASTTGSRLRRDESLTEGDRKAIGRQPE